MYIPRILMLLLLLVLPPMWARAEDGPQDASPGPADVDAPASTLTPAPLVPAEPVPTPAARMPEDAPTREQVTPPSRDHGAEALRRRDEAYRRNAHINGGALTGLGVGIIVGGVGGAFVGYYLLGGGGQDSGCSGSDCSLVPVALGIVGGIIGAFSGGLVGTGIGASVAAKEWDEAARRTRATSPESQPKASSGLRLTPAFGVGAGGAMGGVIGRF